MQDGPRSALLWWGSLVRTLNLGNTFLLLACASILSYCSWTRCHCRLVAAFSSNSRAGSRARWSHICPHCAKTHLVSAVRGMMSLCYGNITRVVVSGVSVTLCGPCRQACHWPDTKPCGSVTRCRPGAIKTKIVLKEINSCNQRNTHTLLPYRYTGTRTEDTSLHTHSNITHKQSF